MLAGLTGGTTPACALSPFGRRFFEPAPTLTRMLIDYEGEAPVAGLATPAALIISRPVSTVFTAWQWDIPGGAQAPPALLLLPPLINGVEVFTPNAIALGGPLIFAGVGLPGHSIRVSPINFTVPAGIVANSMMVQVICWFPGLPQPGGLTCTGADTTEMVGSAGMWLPL